MFIERSNKGILEGSVGNHMCIGFVAMAIGMLLL